MAIAIKFQCGCGFRSQKPTEAIKHCEEKKHCLTIQGEVKPENK